MAIFKPTAIDVRGAMARLKIFEGQLGYPPNPQALLVAATAFARIVHFKPPTEIVPAPPVELEGVEDDAAWLAAQMYERYDRFQTMQKFRELYRIYLPPRYSREDWDI